MQFLIVNDCSTFYMHECTNKYESTVQEEKKSNIIIYDLKKDMRSKVLNTNMKYRFLQIKYFLKVDSVNYGLYHEDVYTLIQTSTSI